jgi:hypothetical protein
LIQPWQKSYRNGRNACNCYRTAALVLATVFNGSEDLERDRRIRRVLLAVNCLNSENSYKNS